MNMITDIIEIKKMICYGLETLVAMPEFSNWFEKEHAQDGDIVIINNSFIYRKPMIKTSKNTKYLCLKVKGSILDKANVYVVQPKDFDDDFKRFSKDSLNLPVFEPLEQAIQTEMNRIGRFVLLLIGELKENPASVSLNHRYATELKFAPSAESNTIVPALDNRGKIIIINNLTDPESVWNSLKPNLENELLPSLEKVFVDAFEKLQDEARLKLMLPTKNSRKTNNSFIGRLHKSVFDQRRVYESILKKSKNNGGVSDRYLREIMRIAYNFSDDAIDILKLLVSISDIKAILLWCTIKEHFDVAVAFHNLPWTKSNKKPSLERYREIISGARNQAFHNLLRFDRTIEADLEGVDMKARRLTMLQPYGLRNTGVTFDYDDREIVEILTDLTRAKLASVPFNFWLKNIAVMKSFENLLKHTEDALWVLNRITQN